MASRQVQKTIRAVKLFEAARLAHNHARLIKAKLREMGYNDESDIMIAADNMAHDLYYIAVHHRENAVSLVKSTPNCGFRVVD